MLVTCQIPDPDGPILPTTGQKLPIRTHFEGPDGPMTRFLHPHTLRSLNIPPAQQPVTASADQLVTAWTPGQRIDPIEMLLKSLHTLSAPHIPHEEFSITCVAPATSQPHPIGTPSHTHNPTLMPRQSLQQCAILALPQVHAPIIAATD